MSRKRASHKPEAEKDDAITQPTHDWLSPASAAAPCGPDLEYDQDFIVLFASALPKQDAQYGAFVDLPAPVNWSEVDRDCRRLMMRCKDIRVAVLFTRCRTRLAGAAGLAEGTGLLAAWLQAFAQEIHPHPGVDADRDASLEMRMNALQALTDTEGLLGDVRQIALTQSTAEHLQVRDVERAFAHPRPADAPASDSVAQQLRDLRVRQPSVMLSFDEALANLGMIAAWSAEHLDAFVPDLTPLTRLLQHLTGQEPQVDEPQSDGAKPAPADDVAPAHGISTFDERLPCAPPSVACRDGTDRPVLVPAVSRGDGTPADRQAALELIRAARHWFEKHEPSSPIPVLLKRAEQFIGKRYAEVVQAIPTELLALWEEDSMR